MNISDYKIKDKPFYQNQKNESELYKAAYNKRMPLMLKGPTGCGKSRFVEHMAYTLNKPLITVACNEDMSASDLVGRFLLDKDGTRWVDGPLTNAARYGAICYLDEIVEARSDTTVIIHPLTDYRRLLPLDKKGELIAAHRDFALVISYNPGYQSLMKDLKQSTKQRFVCLEFDYPDADTECKIIISETGIDEKTARKLILVAEASRNLKGHGLDEGISTRLLVYCATLLQQKVPAKQAVFMALISPITDDDDIKDAILKTAFASSLFEN
jgi:nitric oxide reductase NorQ protein